MDERDYKAMNNQLREESENENSVFDKSLFNNLDVKKAEYIIGVDAYDENTLSYCFGRKLDGVLEVMITKTMSDKSEFNQEVENLAKYFNAEIIPDND